MPGNSSSKCSNSTNCISGVFFYLLLNLDGIFKEASKSHGCSLSRGHLPFFCVLEKPRGASNDGMIVDVISAFCQNIKMQCQSKNHQLEVLTGLLDLTVNLLSFKCVKSNPRLNLN